MGGARIISHTFFLAHNPYTPIMLKLYKILVLSGARLDLAKLAYMDSSELECGRKKVYHPPTQLKIHA